MFSCMFIVFLIVHWFFVAPGQALNFLNNLKILFCLFYMRFFQSTFANSKTLGNKKDILTTIKMLAFHL